MESIDAFNNRILIWVGPEEWGLLNPLTKGMKAAQSFDQGSGPSCPLDESAHKKFIHKIKLTGGIFSGNNGRDLARLLSSNITIMSEGNHRDASLVCPEVDIYQFGYPRNQDKALESIDSRFLMLLESFRDLFIRRNEVFKKLFPELHDEFVGMFRKIGNVNLYIEKPSQVKTRALCLQRSFSVDSPRTPLINGGGSPLTLERFKVHTVVRGGGGQGSSKSK
ncbi:hypothetical protein OIU79_005300 [Salix purpurea]|uniref:Uncharacterized protein n=1 Tax=Salix purpurea TaxID=77065 RepID=A0A9Q0ZAC8_SALPP|nr:hypothetical protein OIU79_005300 [Salix purpurea]